MIFLCSRNARPQKALVGRAQWKINQPPSLERETSKLGRIIWKDEGRSMRAAKDSPVTPLVDEVEKNEKKVACWSLCSRNAHDRNVLVRRAQWEPKQTTLP